jgi:hypothetical protein
MRFLPAVGAFVAAFALQTAAQAAVVYVNTGQPNANTTVDTAHTSYWNLQTGNNPFQLGGGVFELKRGNSASAPIVLTLYIGTNLSIGAVVATRTVYTPEFDVLQGNNATYSPTNIYFGTEGDHDSNLATPDQLITAAPLTLLANTNYYLALSSTTGTSGSEQYFIKSTNDQFVYVNDGGQQVDPNSGTVVETPEPTSMLLLMAGLAGLGAARRRIGGMATA